MTTASDKAAARAAGAKEDEVHARVKHDLHAGVAAMHEAGISFDHGGAHVVAAYVQACAVERHRGEVEALARAVKEAVPARAAAK